jgi:hypothetical protein
MSDDKLDMILEELRYGHRDHERRLRALERIVGYGSGVVGMGLFVLKILRVI